MLEDLFADVFTVDSKILRSIIPLLFKPGSLSLDYTKGKRDSYVKPFRLYLFSSLIFFFFAFLNIGDGSSEDNSEIISDTDTLSELSLNDTLDPKGNLVIHLRGRGIALSYFHPDSGAVDSIIVDEKESFIDKKFENMTYGDLKEKEESLSANFKESIPNVMFFLVPVFALVFKLLYIRQRKFYVGHLIFVFHLHAFFFILLLILSLIAFLVGLIWDSTILDIVLSALAFIILFVYTYKAMKTVYKQKAWITLTKLGLIIISYLIIILLSLVGILIGSIILL